MAPSADDPQRCRKHNDVDYPAGPAHYFYSAWGSLTLEDSVDAPDVPVGVTSGNAVRHKAPAHPAPRPSLFVAKGKPQEWFPPGFTPAGGGESTSFSRFVDRDHPTRALVYVDGACLANGQAGARAGWGFVYRQAGTNQIGLPVSGSVSGRLENRGPSNEAHPQTSNRAELRSVLAVLQFHDWTRDNIKTLVLATDSEYVAHGCTSWVYDWERNNWRTKQGRPVANKDLWQALLKEFRRWSVEGLEVWFWPIPRELNSEADKAARAGAAEPALDFYAIRT